MDFSSWTRPKLISFLKERDFAASILKKDQLIALAARAEELGIPAVEEDDAATPAKAFRCIGREVVHKHINGRRIVGRAKVYA